MIKTSLTIVIGGLISGSVLSAIFWGSELFFVIGAIVFWLGYCCLTAEKVHE